MSEGKDYDLHTHTQMDLEHVPGKCCRNIPRRVKQQRNNDHNALVTSMWKDDGVSTLVSLIVDMENR